MAPCILLWLALLQSPAACPDVAACRAEAEAAASRGDFETFHDFAWRTVQKGKPNDPALMFLLARAQALSGRFDDAMVMLTRLADLHAAIDLSLPDFDRARRLPGWAALEAMVSGAPAAAPETPSATSSAAPPPRIPPVAAPPDVGAPAAAKAMSPSRSKPASADSGAVPSASDPGDVTAFEAPANLGAFAIAHDSVSRRFVIGDAPSRRLLIVDEVSKHVVPYVSAASAGFYDDLTAFTVDARRGDLWVASAKGSGDETTSIVHKLQLVSGRGLMDVSPAESRGPVRLVDLGVAPDGTVYALDAAGGRVFRLRPGSRTLDVVLRVEAAHPSALAVADDRTLFVASERGLLRVDVPSRAVQAVKSVEDLSGFASLAWRGGALYGVQQAGGASLAVRVALDAAGTRAQPRAILAASPSSIVATVTDGGFYYLLLGAIHRLPLR